MTSQNGHEGWEAAGMSPLGLEMASVENARVVPTALRAHEARSVQGSTLTETKSETPSMLATISACPGARPRTTPPASTLATAGDRLRHVTSIAGSSSPSASYVSADKVTVCPSRIEAV